MTNAACWREAQRYLAGGVNSPVRSFKAVGMNPLFIDRGEGPYLWDVEGKKYLDYVSSWGALIVGHRHPEVFSAIRKALQKGTTFGTPTPQETALACAITQSIPSMEQVRFVTSGTEAVMSAVRLARAATGRRKILKFNGGYHGHLDALLTQAGSGMATLGIPSSPGVPKNVAQDTITIPFNDPEAARRAINRHSSDLACVLVEPVQANIGVIPPEKNLLPLLRRLTHDKKILLVFDEVITGFRVAFGGAQSLYGVTPDLTILGKIIGGGFPIGAYGGPRKLMQLVAPAGPVYQAGTLAGHPVSMAAGLATLKILRRPHTYTRLSKKTVVLARGLSRIGKKRSVGLTVNHEGGLLSIFFSKRGSYVPYFRSMLKQGIYLPPSAFEAWFPSVVHGEKEIEATLRAHEIALKAVHG